MKKYTRRCRNRFSPQAPRAPRYTRHNITTYTVDIARAPRNTRAREYVQNVNAINTIDTLITNTPHATVYQAAAPYRKFVLAPPDAPLTRPVSPKPSIYTSTDTVKAIVYDSAGERVIWFGIIRRTREIAPDGVRITLHKGAHTFPVYTYLPPTDTVFGVSAREIRKHGVECYHI